jgi:hypothetical protein
MPTRFATSQAPTLRRRASQARSRTDFDPVWEWLDAQEADEYVDEVTNIKPQELPVRSFV